MPRILILHENEGIRSQLRELLPEQENSIVESSSVKMARMESAPFDLYICGQLGKYSDGFIFALEKLTEYKKVLLLTEKNKFSLIPTLHPSQLRSKSALDVIRTAMAGD